MATIADYKDKVGEQYFIVDESGKQVKYKNNDEVPFTLAAIKKEKLFLIKTRGSWQHREDFDNERLQTQKLVRTLK